MRDPDHLYQDLLIDDPINHPIHPSTRAPITSQLEPKLFSNAIRVGRQIPADELPNRGGHRLRQVTFKAAPRGAT